METDTIVALATPPGIGAVGLVRLSGSKAVGVASALTSRPADQWEPRVATLCHLLHPNPAARPDDKDPAKLDQALVTVFPGPASYTGEDVVEISTHGGYLVPRSVVEACLLLGAREAEAGEFTQRAFLNGKLDLTQAEAVGDLVSAVAPQAKAVALHQLARGLGDRVSDLRHQVIGLEALLIQHVDFPEEDEAPVGLERVAEEGRRVALTLANLIATAPTGELLRNGALTVLAGAPNAGKSSLFNALVGTARAIVTDEPGTTRDALEATVSIDGFPFRLVDTAGLRRDPGTVESLGIEVAERYLSQADLVLFCNESGQGGLSDEALDFIASVEAPKLLVHTKADVERGDGPTVASHSPDLGFHGSVAVSSFTGQGLDTLADQMNALVFQGVVENRGEVPVVTNARQRSLLETAEDEVAKFAKAIEAGVPPEAAGSHLKSAESALEEMLGIVSTDDVLDRVFREFCVGK
ncbi:MAG: tRNA uridine-5-carboxymethylaminomethyl(34) synthesis GTPase MnmE [Longimicrobiales bacterium]